MLRTYLEVMAVSAASLLSTAANASIVSDWNNTALAEVRMARFGPPIVARALAIAHTCMYDAWAAYDARAIGAVVGRQLRRPVVEHTDANKAKAISFAAYRCLVNLFPGGTVRLDAAMRLRGYDPLDVTTNPAWPQGIGNIVARAVIDSRRNDGANQYGDLAPGAYADYTAYVPRNAPMPFCLPTTPGPCTPNIADRNRWQPLISDTGSIQRFIAPHWERVMPFALESASQLDAFAPEPHFLLGSSEYLADVDQLVAISGALTLQQKLLVEYWADGPESELPPGHWGLFAQYVSRRDAHSIDKDAKMFFAMHNASFDAGIVAWHLKRKYDGVRPITAVRDRKKGKMIFAWGGPEQPNQWIAGEKWTPYNPGSNLSPAFPGYISGHSTFSAASAEVLRRFTGSDNFGFTTVIPPDFGRVEPGVPLVPTLLGYPTFSAAVEEAGVSRLLAGIHFADDNTVGQELGTMVGQTAWTKARFLFDGVVAEAVDAVLDTKSKSMRWSHTVPSSSNRLLLVGLSVRNGSDPVTSVSHGAVPLVRLGVRAAPGNQNRVELWYLVAPLVGTADILVTMPKDRKVAAGAVTFSGVDQGAPFGVLGSGGDDSDSACATLANAQTGLVASVLGANGDAKVVDGVTGQNGLWNLQTGSAGGEIIGTGQLVAVAPFGTVCEALQKAKPWSLLAVQVRPVSAP